MALSRALLLSLLLSLVFLNLLQSNAAMPVGVAPAPSPISRPALDCSAACQYRCSKSWKAKMCNKLCIGCCNKCNCVPAGPTANRNVCTCYATLRNPKTGAYKCP